MSSWSVARGSGRYEGGWQDGRKSGFGVVSWADGTRYEGEWKDGRPDGFGVLMLVSGERYEGEGRGVEYGYGFERHGHGVGLHPSGGRYEGEWRLNRLDGYGSWVDGQGKTLTGRWLLGKLVNPLQAH